MIDGRIYRVDGNTKQNPALLHNGDVISGTVADIELLLTMKEYEDAKTNEEKEAAMARMVELLLTNGEDISVNLAKPYSYYILDEDVTKRLQEFMRDSYEEYHSKLSWFFRLYEFYNLVRNGGPFDLKNQEGWQKASFIYEGEVIDGDAIANITFGYLGKVMGIPDPVLLAGAGFAQIMAGTSDLDYILSFGDDPRDSMRILQGINQYYKDHPEEAMRVNIRV